MELIIRDETPGDIDGVRDILQAAFPGDAESRLVDALRANGKATVSLVAVSQVHMLGHILFSPVSTSPPSEARGIGLAPVAVRPDVQSRGIGMQLIREGLHRCAESGYDYCVVLGSPQYYSRFGFARASQFGLHNEYGVEDEFMVIRFSNRDLLAGAAVKYSSEFGLFSV